MPEIGDIYTNIIEYIINMIDVDEIDSIEEIRRLEGGHDLSNYEFSGLDYVNPRENCCGKFYDPDGNEHIIDYRDEEIWKLVNEQKVDTVFQFDTSLASRILRDASVGKGVHNVDMLIFLNACGHPGPMACVEENTLVSTGNGQRKIGELDPASDTILYLDDEGNISETSEYMVVEVGVKDCYRINLEDGREMVATADHRFLTQNGYKRLDELTEDDYLIGIDPINIP
jgi:intein/homing endonuclease